MLPTSFSRRFVKPPRSVGAHRKGHEGRRGGRAADEERRQGKTRVAKCILQLTNLINSRAAQSDKK